MTKMAYTMYANKILFGNINKKMIRFGHSNALAIRNNIPLMQIELLQKYNITKYFVKLMLF